MRHKSDCLCQDCLDAHTEKIREMAEGMRMPTALPVPPAGGDLEICPCKDWKNGARHSEEVGHNENCPFFFQAAGRIIRRLTVALLSPVQRAGELRDAAWQLRDAVMEYHHADGSITLDRCINACMGVDRALAAQAVQGKKEEGGHTVDDVIAAKKALAYFAIASDPTNEWSEETFLGVARLIFRKVASLYSGGREEGEPVAQGLPVPAAQNWEAVAMSLASSYGCALTALGDVKSFLRLVVAKSVNKYGACIYCVRHLDHGHAEGCKLVEIQKRMAAFESPSPATRSDVGAEGSPKDDYLAAIFEIDRVMNPHKEKLFLVMRDWVRTRTPNELIVHIESGLQSTQPSAGGDQ